jgi:2-keto-4-pentenoate hydratase/2-oxohepta-3-ene-1,7-dioic acid hydratase in catechol pathway
VPAVADGEGWLDLSSVVPDLDGAALAPAALARIRDAVDSGDLPPVTPVGRFGPPLGRIGKIVCIGLNYRDHARETGATLPQEPVVFMKAPDTVVGPDDEVLVPRGSTRTDWEVELAVVIGATCAYLASPADAVAAIAGYTISHDVSERTFQLDRGGQWDKGKNCATFNPFGPWLVTGDEIADPQDLDLALRVNGVPMQQGNTGEMVFGVNHLVWYLSQFMTLYPGDVINTGTPAGVALGDPGKRYLQPGDVVELEISGLGRQRQVFGKA